MRLENLSSSLARIAFDEVKDIFKLVAKSRGLLGRWWSKIRSSVEGPLLGHSGFEIKQPVP